MRGPVLLATCLLAAAPAAAQQVTFEQAVRTNLTIAVQFCITPGVGGETWVSWFRQSGFTERSDLTEGDSTYHFHAPADTAMAEVYFGQMPDHCRAWTNHLGVTEASALLDAILPAVYPTYTRIVEHGPVNPATGRAAVCVRFEDPANPIGDVIGVAVANPSSDLRCVENGTSAIYSSSRV